MKASSRTVVIQASAFCYGPASIGLALAQELRLHAPGDSLRLIALGEATSFELFTASRMFDEVHALGLADLEDPDHLGTAALRKADLLVSVGDFDFAQRVPALGQNAVMVDPLYWMWDRDPIRIDTCREYFALDFPGVRQRVEEHARRAPDDRAPIVVEPIYDVITASPLLRGDRRNTLLINFGGMQSPLGTNIPLAQAMTESLVKIALERCGYDEIHVCGGGQPIQLLARGLEIRDPRLHVGPLDQKSFFEQLAACQDFVTVPGLSIVYEALHFHCKTFFALPLNYSQHRQSQVYRNVLRDAHFIFWDDLDGYATLPAGLPEEQGVAQALELGERFAADSAAREQLGEIFWRFLNAPGQGISLARDAAPALAGFDGARQIARRLLGWEHEARAATLER